MATDNTEVPTGRVILIAVIALGTLAAVRESIVGYYHSMYDEGRHHANEAPSPVLVREREEEARRLANVDQAMRQVGGAVGSDTRPDAIRPMPSTDLQPLQGWQQRPRIVPNPPPVRGDLPAGAQVPTPAPAAGTAPAGGGTPAVNGTPSAAVPAPTVPSHNADPSAPQAAPPSAPIPTPGASPTVPAGAPAAAPAPAH